VILSSGSRKEEGQVIPVLLLAAVGLVWLALTFLQVGSAAEQKTQTRTATDSAVVSATHLVRDASIADASHQVPHSWAPPIFDTVAPVTAGLHATACDAAQANWSGNPHHHALSCGGLAVSQVQLGARAELDAPAGEVVSGPVNAAAAHAHASATAQVVLDRCPRGFGASKAVADWIADRTMQLIGGRSDCYTSGDEEILAELDQFPEDAFAAIGPPQDVLDSVRNGMHIEIVQ
jgi:hypothetical protein